MPARFILIYRTPTGEIKAYAHREEPTLYVFPLNAALASYAVLAAAGIDIADARLFAEKLSQQRPGTVWGHPTRYDFRVLHADFTVNNVAITPGLRVLDYDREWGAVEETQFMAQEYTAPGGQYFDNWYYVRRDGETSAHKKFNGERLTTREA